MPTLNEVVDLILQNEGGSSNHPDDAGGRTDKGISEGAHPDAWKDGVISDEEARHIYINKYVKGPHFDQVKDGWLQVQLVDFGVLSGPALAIMKLQSILGVMADGILGPKTLAAIDTKDVRWLNNKLIAERIMMLGRIVQRDKSQIIFLAGWLQRSLSFLR